MKLLPCLITSFNVQQSIAKPAVSTDSIQWPDQLKEKIHADIYLMMESDVIAWNNQLGRTPEHVSALEFMSSIEPRHLTQLADTIIANAKGKQISVHALTSFFPSLSLPVDHKKQRHANLVANLMRLAMRLGDGLGRVPVIQMVAGSLISKIEPQSYQGRDVVFAECGDPKAMFNVILDQIEEALQIVGQDPEFQEFELEKLRIAFELEPGPIYLLSDRKSMEACCNQIDNRPSEINRMVGFNLDIPHWWIAENISPSWIRSDDDELSVRVRERVFHSHIAGHSERGHFGDMSLTRMPKHQIEIFKDWLSAVSELDHVDSVSLEMEAAPSFSEVCESLTTLLQWLKTPVAK